MKYYTKHIKSILVRLFKCKYVITTYKTNDQNIWSISVTIIINSKDVSCQETVLSSQKLLSGLAH